MKNYYIFIISFITFIISYQSLSSDVFDSNFFKIEIVTSNANEAKSIIIEDIKDKSLSQLIDKILTIESKAKYNQLLRGKIFSDQFIKNIIIDKEIITNEKYIADIKINFDKEKIISLLRNNKINYTDIESEPFLIISSHNINFIKAGLDKGNSLQTSLREKANNSQYLIKYFFPILNTNDRFLLPYEKIVSEDSMSFNNILDKYKVKKIIYINIKKSNIKDLLNVNIKLFDNSFFKEIDDFNVDNTKYQNIDELFDNLTNNILIYLNEWWKKNNQIDNSNFNQVQCVIKSKNFDDLIKIKFNIAKLSQVKYVKTKKIRLDNNLIDLGYYGDFDLLIKSLSFSNVFYHDTNGCVIKINK